MIGTWITSHGTTVIIKLIATFADGFRGYIGMDSDRPSIMLQFTMDGICRTDRTLRLEQKCLDD